MKPGDLALVLRKLGPHDGPLFLTSITTWLCVACAAESLGFEDIHEAVMWGCWPDVLSAAIEAAEALEL